MSYNAKNKLGFGLYHLQPRWCRYADFKKILDKNIFNSYILGCGYGTSRDAAKMIAEQGGQIWLGFDGPYCSCRDSLSDYMDKLRGFVEKLKEDGTFEQVVGFHWDEPLSKPDHTNEDFLAMTRALYEEYGLRNYPVFSSQELIGAKGNMDDPDSDRMLQPFACEFITDIGYDSYGYDFRKPAGEGLEGRFATLREEGFDGVCTTEDYYRFFIKRMQQLMGEKEARIWLYPCTYHCGRWGGGETDEDYCIAHLEGMAKLLLEQKNPGGLHCYTYKSWRLNARGLDYYLSDQNPQRWNRLETCLEKVSAQLRDIDIR